MGLLPLASHSLTKVVFPKPAGAEIRDNLLPSDRPSSSRSSRRVRTTTLGGSGGIYSVETDQLIVDAPPSWVRGWMSDGLGAIYSSGGRCLIRRFELFADDIGCAVEVPQPVVLLKLPDEYLSSQ